MTTSALECVEDVDGFHPRGPIRRPPTFGQSPGQRPGSFEIKTARGFAPRGATKKAAQTDSAEITRPETNEQTGKQTN